MKRAPKEMTDEEIKDSLMEIGVSTHKGTRKTKFSGFSAYAREVASRNPRKDYNTTAGITTVDEVRKNNENVVNERLGGNPYAHASANATGGNPYAQPAASGTPSGNPYASMNTSNPYASTGSASSGNPYSSNNSAPYEQGRQSSDPYAQRTAPPAAPHNSDPYAQRTAPPAAPPSSSGGNPYAQGDLYGQSHNSSQGHEGYGDAAPRSRAPNPYTGSTAYGGADYASGQFETGITEKSRDELFGAARTRSVMGRSGMGVRSTAPTQDVPLGGHSVARRASLTTLDELNAAPDPGEPDEDEDELLQMPSTLNNQQPQTAEAYAQTYEGEMNSEDEDVEEIKREIRFTKKESVQSTRNTLAMAAEAEAAGRNTLGMLGSQGERIANTERTLALAESQTRIADEQSRELLRLQRSIFVPNVSNPFNSKRRMQEKEAKIKSEHLQEQIMRERRRQVAFESEQRVINGLNQPMVSETAQKYKTQLAKESEERRRMQFEADSEDEEIEGEIDANLEGISQASSRLKNLSLSMNDEIETQNRRLDRITDQTDNLDVDIHLSAARLTSIR